MYCIGENASLALKGFAAYTSSKAAVIHLSNQVATEAAEFGIRVVCVNPGFTASEGLPQAYAEGFQKVNVVCVVSCH